MGLNIWLILGGVGIFLFGIMLLEQALQKLMSRRFKLFLRRQTGNTFRAIFSGDFIGMLKAEGINELLFLNNIFAAHTPFHISNIKGLTSPGSTKAKP